LTARRVLPVVDDGNAPFWTGGRDGVLRILRCLDCGTWIHPPRPVCPQDHSRRLEWSEASGRGRLASWTLNLQRWLPGFEPPYLVALVELEEQPQLRLMTNLAHCETADLSMGMPLRVIFERCEDEYGEVWIPLFEPDGGDGEPG
jgi:uncharacterized OB-fold protein